MNEHMPDFAAKCIMWGGLSLHGQLDNKQRELWEELTHDLESDRTRALEDLANGLEIVLDQTKQALDCLESRKTLYLVEDDVDFSKAVAGDISKDMIPELAVAVAMKNLDQLLYLGHALERLEQDAEDAPGPLAEAADKVFSLLDDIALERDMPWHRLIPLNRLRRKMIRNVAEDNRYLFPWYEEWSKESPYTWSELASAIADKDEEFNLDPVLRELLLDDDPLYGTIMHEAFLCKQLPLALAEDQVFQVLRQADRMALSSEALSGVILQKGRVDAAIRVAVNDILAGVPQEKWRAEAAVFGMGLGFEEREDILMPVFERWRELSPGDPLAFIPEMKRRLEKVSQEGFVRIPGCNKVYRSLLTSGNPERLALLVRGWDSAWRMVSAPAGILERMRRIFEQAVGGVTGEGPGFEPEFALAGARGGEAGQETAPFPVKDFPSKPLEMPPVVEETRRGRKRYLLRVMGEPELSGLRERIAGFRDLYWAGFYLRNGEVKEFSPRHGLPSFLELEDGQEPDLLVLFIAPGRDLLVKALDGEEVAERQVTALTYVKPESRTERGTP